MQIPMRVWRITPASPGPRQVVELTLDLDRCGSQGGPETHVEMHLMPEEAIRYEVGSTVNVDIALS